MHDLTKKDDKKFWKFLNYITRPVYIDRSSKAYFVFFIIMAVLFAFLTCWTFITHYYTPYSEFRYDNQCTYENTSGNICHLQIEIDKDYDADSYIYFGVKNFRQAYPRMVHSINFDQLAGKKPIDKLDSCLKFKTNLEMEAQYSYKTREVLDPEADAVPCGLMAKNFPRDMFYLYDQTEQAIPISDENISYPGLRGNKYKNVNTESSWVSVENEK